MTNAIKALLQMTSVSLQPVPSLCIFIFLNKTTNGGSENNLVYSNARELMVQNRKKRYNTSQKGL
jgi:hypothetical protein